MPSPRIALAPLLLLVAAGCATPYVPSERMRRLQVSMDPADAANLFADSLGRRLQGAGLCRAPWRFDDPGAEVTMDGFTVRAWRAGEELGRKQEGGKTVVSYRKERYEVSGRFAAIERIEVHADAAGPCAVEVPFGQSAVTLRGAGEAFPMVIAVTPPSVDELLAALAILAPAAERVMGEGRQAHGSRAGRGLLLRPDLRQRRPPPLHGLLSAPSPPRGRRWPPGSGRGGPRPHMPRESLVVTWTSSSSPWAAISAWRAFSDAAAPRSAQQGRPPGFCWRGGPSR